jgi:hypothetical protein
LAEKPGSSIAWELRATSAFDIAHFNEMIPVMAALSVFATAFEPMMDGNTPLHVVGVELTKDGQPRELDFVIATQDFLMPAIIVGEAKAGHPDAPKPGELLTATDLGLLESVQDSIRAIGIDCWISFTTSRPRLQQSEVDLLRRSCERALTPVYDTQGLVIDVLPIVLTGEALSMPSMDQRHPVRQASDFPRLPALGRQTCARELGLVGMDRELDDSGQWQSKPRWSSH